MNGWEILKYMTDSFEEIWDIIMDWYDDIIN
jgi:hypothetical protein